MSPLALIFVALFNSILGLSVLFPILGPLGRELNLRELEIGSLTTVYALAQFVGSSYWGKQSELLGRKPVLLRGILGFSATFFAFGLIAQCGRAGWLQGTPLFLCLLATRAIGGLYSSATLPSAQAYVADVTNRNDRTAGMAVVGAAFGLGIVFGPAIGAMLAPVGLLVPVYFSAGIALLNALFVHLRLPESKRDAQVQQPPELRAVASKVWVLLAVGFATTLASVSMEQTIAFYFQDRLNLNTTQAARSVGFSLVLYGVVAVLIQGGFVRRAKWPPLRLLRLGIPISAAGLLLLVWAPGETWLMIAMAVQGLGQALTAPGVTAALSLGVEEHEQGAVAGLNSSTGALARTLGPVLGTGLYEIRPQYPFAFGAAVLALVFVFVMVSPSLLSASPRPSRSEAP